MKQFILASAFLLMAVAGFAQPNGRGPRPERGPNFEKLQAELELSDEQVAEWKTLHESQKEKMMVLRDDDALEREAKRTQMKAMRDEMNEAIKGILTEEQYTKLEAMRPKVGRKGGPKGGRRKKKGKKKDTEGDNGK